MDINNRIRIRDIHDPAEANKLEEIQVKAWGTSEVVPAHVFIAASTVEGIVKGAYIDNKLVGYVFGFLGKFLGRICLYSHQLAVSPEHQNKNIGYLLKNSQKEYASAIGLELIVWTFDPLQSKNAYFNINKLGCIAKRYFPNHYGEMKDELNKGIPSDRFMAEWWIKSRWVNEKESSKYKYMEDYPDKDRVKIVLKAIGSVEFPRPVEQDETGKLIGIEIPIDINSIKRRDLRLARKWRLETRKVFTKYFSRNYVVIRYLKYKSNGGKGIYILNRGFDLDEYREI